MADIAGIREEVQDEAVQRATQFFQQEFFSAVVGQCFDACRRKHLGASLSEADQVCMRRCSDKLLASFAITSQVFYSRNEYQEADDEDPDARELTMP